MDPESLLKPIDPPAGGLDGLRRAIHRRDRRRQGAMAVMTLAAVFATAWWIAPAGRQPPVPTTGDPPLLRLASHDSQASVRVVGGTATEWSPGPSSTRIYWVDSDNPKP